VPVPQSLLQFSDQKKCAGVDSGVDNWAVLPERPVPLAVKLVRRFDRREVHHHPRHARIAIGGFPKAKSDFLLVEATQQ
jgi:hypothetical protein